MFGALRDCVPRMAAVRHMATPKELTDAYDREIYGYFKEVKSWRIVYNGALFQIKVKSTERVLF